MLTLAECSARSCRYPVTDEPPHYFCGEMTDGRSYCPEHDALCHAGQGKDWQALVGMINAVEQTVVLMPPRRDGGEPAALDNVLREAAEYFDEAGGLMART